MHLGPAPFCGRVGYELRSDDEKAHVMRELADAYGVRVLQSRVTETYHAGMLSAVLSRPHAVTVLTRGVPCVLYLMRHDFAGVCVFVERRAQVTSGPGGGFYPRMTVARLSFEDTLFDGTVLDGELTEPSAGSPSWTFWAGDLLADSSTSLAGAPGAVRMRALRKVVARQHYPDDSDVCIVRLKPLRRTSDARSLLPGAGGGCWSGLSRGLLLVPLERAGRSVEVPFSACDDRNDGDRVDGRARGMLPGRRAHDAATTTKRGEDRGAGGRQRFWVRRTGMSDVYELFQSEAHAKSSATLAVDGLRPIVAGVPTLAASRMLRSAFERRQGDDALVPMVFEFSAAFGKWVPCLLSGKR